MHGHISATAFLSCESKSRGLAISQDLYAHLWTTPETSELWIDFAQEACPHDDLELSIRNRFFLEKLVTFVRCSQGAKGHSISPVLLNVGSGFSSYPLLVEDPLRSMEVDFPHILSHKAEQIAVWTSGGLLPKRHVTYCPMDLCSAEGIEAFAMRCSEWIRDSPSFVLLEGITYYLPIEILNNLLHCLSRTQVAGSLLALEYWRADIQQFSAFRRLEQYFGDKLGYPKSTYTFLDEEFVSSIPGYKLLEHSSIAALEPLYASTNCLENKNAVLPAYLCLLEAYGPVFSGEQGE